MKTTVEIADPLFQRAKAVAAERGTTLRDLIELGLERVLNDVPTAKVPFKLRDMSVSGRGSNWSDLTHDERLSLMYRPSE